MALFRFIGKDIFGQGAIFLALIAMIGLILQKKDFSAVVRGTLMTAIGFFVLNAGTGLITGSSIDGLSTAFNAILPQGYRYVCIWYTDRYRKDHRICVQPVICTFHQMEIYLPDRTHAVLVSICIHRCRR